MISQKHSYKEELENSTTNQDEAYEELFQATALGKFDYKKTKTLLRTGQIKLNNFDVEKKHRGVSVISNIVRWAATEKEKIKLLKLICSTYPDGKQIIKNASYVQTSLIASVVINNQFALADYLIDEIGMDINQKDSKGKTPLFYLLKKEYIVAANSGCDCCLVSNKSQLNKFKVKRQRAAYIFTNENELYYLDCARSSVKKIEIKFEKFFELKKKLGITSKMENNKPHKLKEVELGIIESISGHVHHDRLEYLLQRGAKIDVEDYKKNKLLDCVKDDEIRKYLNQQRPNVSNSFNKVADVCIASIKNLFSFFREDTEGNKYQLLSQKEPALQNFSSTKIININTIN